MKNLNSKKAREELGDLINSYKSYCEWTTDTGSTNWKYFWLLRALCIVEMQDVYGIPSIHYEQAVESCERYKGVVYNNVDDA